MKYENLLYAFTNNRKYGNPLVIDYLVPFENRTDKSDKIIIIGLFVDDENIEIPEYINGIKVVAIDKNAFTDYHNLKHIVIPKTIDHIAPNAFSDKIIVKYDGFEMSVQDFFVKLKSRQRETIYNQLQGFAKIDINKRCQKSINIIKKSKDKKTAQQNLVKKLGLTDYQAEIYLDCGVCEIAVISHMNIAEKIENFNKLE